MSRPLHSSPTRPNNPLYESGARSRARCLGKPSHLPLVALCATASTRLLRSRTLAGEWERSADNKPLVRIAAKLHSFFTLLAVAGSVTCIGSREGPTSHAPPLGTAADTSAIARLLGAELARDPGGPLRILAAEACAGYAPCVAHGDWGPVTGAATTFLHPIRLATGNIEEQSEAPAICGSGSPGFVRFNVKVRPPIFAGDSAKVHIGSRCGYPDRGFAVDEVLVFRRGAMGWVMVRRAMTRIT
jgi:hypothetical protein